MCTAGPAHSYFCAGCPAPVRGLPQPGKLAFGTGTDMTVQDLFWRVKKNPLVRGVTFSGGEPFSQAEPFTELAKLLKANGYEVASYTGYTFEELLENGTPAQKQLLAALEHTFWWTENSFWHSAIWTSASGSEISASWTNPRALPRAEPVRCTAARWWGKNGRHKRALRPRGTTETCSRAHLMRARLCSSKKGNFVCEVRKIALLCAGRGR